jgi:putative colanic acid biosynthesis acetyltransferase WcaF
MSPQFAYGYRAWLLRQFGARIGKDAIIRPSVTVTYPWKVSLGDNVWLGDDVVLYSLGEINIGSDTVISQRSYLCAGDHDHRRPEFPIRARSITIGEQSWVAADAFIGPGVNIGAGAVIGARSTVLRDMPAAMVCAGNPCRPMHARESDVTQQ